MTEEVGTDGKDQELDDMMKSELAKAERQFTGSERNMNIVLECIRKIQESNPTNQRALLLQGAAHYSLGKLEEACIDMKNAVKHHPTFPEAYCNWGNALRDLRRFEEAEEKYTVALEQREQYPECWNNLGTLHFATGNLDKAETAFQKALSVRPGFHDALNNLGNLHYRRGNKQEAITAYEAIIKACSNQSLVAIAHGNLASVIHSLNQLSRALPHYIRAREIEPTPQRYIAEANALRDAERYRDAADAFGRAIRIDSTSYSAIAQLAGVLLDLHEPSKALALLRANQCPAAQSHPGYQLAMASSLHKCNEPADCLLALKQATTAAELHCPRDVTLWNSIGSLYAAMPGQASAAHSAFARVLEANPNHAPALSNLGLLFRRQGRYQEALSHYMRAIKANPRFAEAYSNVGNFLKLQGDYRKALQYYNRAISLKPSFSDAYGNRAGVYKDTFQYGKALQDYQKCLELNPNANDAFCNMVHLEHILGIWQHRSERLQQLVTILDASLRHIARVRPSGTTPLPPVIPYHCLLYPITAQQSYEVARAYADRNEAEARRHNVTFSFGHFNTRIEEARRSGAPKTQLWPPEAPGGLPADRQPHQASQPNRWSYTGHRLLPLAPFRTFDSPLRIGFVSNDFGDHPTSHLLEEAFRLFDRRRTRVHLYAINPDDGSAMRRSLIEGADVFVDLHGRTAVQVARHIYEDRVQVLVTLMGHGQGLRGEIFALRPCPIQVSLLGHAGTSGSSYIDYIITDRVCSPPTLTHLYSEQLVFMPHTYLVCNHRNNAQGVILADEELWVTDPESEEHLAAEKSFAAEDSLPVVLETRLGQRSLPRGRRQLRRHYGIPEDAFVFINCNQVFKMDPLTMKFILGVLESCPNAVFCMLRFPPQAEPNLRQWLDETNSPAADRVIFLDVVSRREHIRRALAADVFLDTPLCNGHTTIVDALWGGLPVVSFPADGMSSRVSASMLTAAGCSELICSSYSEYEQTAIRLATDPEFYIRLRARLIRSRTESPLFDTRMWVSDFETACHLMWMRWAGGTAPATFSVDEGSAALTPGVRSNRLSRPREGVEDDSIPLAPKKRISKPR
eukprot:gnl/Dysnectes_brevis/2564_a3088_1084.p1 GENE.gnl/Dysnectes_brevis/2564_a3088_1084~~gnl/Dysnectes_brevis/2564_a3088_1084.p1  ORF type:complete len:1094 (+),score=293.61 gnl/Dysnectes_brevis/2564_a3088_1084:42-3284(+)